MSKFLSTQGDSVREHSAHATDIASMPGLVLIFSMGRPYCSGIPVPASGLELGRGSLPSNLPTDSKMSRRHATVYFEGDRFRIVDHGSHNGTFVDGCQINKELTSATARVLRIGDSLFLLCGDIRRHAKLGVVAKGELLLGPAMQDVMAQASRAAQHGKILHITGESGSGKEGVASAFHAASRHDGGPFVAINCATIATGVAERLLFGARRGAYSGAVADSEGLIHSADSGTLFLDEIAELDITVQAKFLRVIETGQVLSLGSLRPRTVDIQLCSASHRNLREELQNGRFREDLYFRINRPMIELPPLRQRREEIPWLIERGLRSVESDLVAHSSFVEACLLRPWPGNVRELLAEVRASGQNALGQGSKRMEPQHLSASGGQAIERPPEPQPVCALAWHPPVARAEPRPPPDRAQIEQALIQAGGKVSTAARRLGIHRTQLRRLLEKSGISAGSADPLRVKEDEEEEE